MVRLGKPNKFGSIPDNAKGVLAGLFVVLCWSGFNIVSRYGSKGGFTPFDMAAIRFGVSGIIAMPFFLHWVPVKEWPRYAFLSLFGGLGYGLCVYSGFAFAPSAHAGVFVNGGIPFCTIVIAMLATRIREKRFVVPRRIALALILSSCGLSLIGFDGSTIQHSQNEWIGDFLFLAAALSISIFGLLQLRWNINPAHGICGVSTFASLIYLPVYLWVLPKTILRANWADIGVQCVYQGIVAALLAGGMYSFANRKIGASRASLMLALVPALTAGGAFFWLREDLNTRVIVGICIVSLGATLGVLPSKGAQKTLALIR